MILETNPYAIRSFMFVLQIKLVAQEGEWRGRRAEGGFSAAAVLDFYLLWLGLIPYRALWGSFCGSFFFFAVLSCPLPDIPTGA